MKICERSVRAEAFLAEKDDEGTEDETDSLKDIEDLNIADSELRTKNLVLAVVSGAIQTPAQGEKREKEQENRVNKMWDMVHQDISFPLYGYDEIGFVIHRHFLFTKQ